MVVLVDGFFEEQKEMENEFDNAEVFDFDELFE